MSIFVLGINYKTAPIAVRESIYFAEDKLSLYLQDLLRRGLAREAVLLSTCNRTELYCDTDDILAIRKWFCMQAAANAAELESAIYIYQNQEAVAHIMSVACGFDSMVVGEPQILGQLKDAFSESCSADTVNSQFHRLFQEIFSVAKEIRTTTSVGACPVSVASAAVNFAREQVSSFSDSNIVLIGAGDTTEILYRYLHTQVSRPLTLLNRTLDKAVSLADSGSAYVHSLEKLPQVLHRADIIFSATGSPVPIVSQSMVADALKIRRYKPMLLIDIAMPRDMDPAIADLENAQLYCIDDLKNIIEKNRKGREHAANKSYEMIMERSSAFITKSGSHDKVTHTIRAYRGQIEEICAVELKKARQQLMQGEDPADVLECFAYAFTQKLLHVPSVQLRQAGIEGRFELLKFAKQLFAIPDPEIERL